MATANYVTIKGEHYAVNHPLARKHLRIKFGEVVCDPLEADSTHFEDKQGTKPHPTPAKCVKTRIRQSSKPLMNKLEQEFSLWIRSQRPARVIWEQALTFRLCNGVRYSPDIVTWQPVGVTSGILNCYDVKGRQMIEDDASVKVKFAAKEFPQFGWYIVWKVNGEWLEQKLLS